MKKEIAAPVLSAESRPYYEAAAAGKFLIKRCTACDKNFWYPRAICPFCMGDDTEWLEASGKGVVYTYSVTRRAKVPYVLAYVTLDEGPTMLTNLVNLDHDAIRIGQKVQVTFETAVNGAKVPMFEPCVD
ncbi:MAG: OB-fold domain-containing protein [Burkholderiaceae bacterium]